MLTRNVNIRNPKISLAELVKLVLQGEDVLLTDNHEPLARLVPATSFDQPRVAGLNAGDIWVSDDFDRPLPDAFWLTSP